MRIQTRAAQGYLGYCANVHPGETLDDVLTALRSFGPAVRDRLGVEALSYGLWLSRTALTAARGVRRRELQQALEDSGLLALTFNGFPYGNFHAHTVKRGVYHPDLGSPERRAYLFELAQLLCGLLPDDAEEGTISTLPIGHRDDPPDASALGGTHSAQPHAVQLSAARALCGLCEDLARLRDQTKKSVRICLEPEPGCWIETTQDAIRFFCEYLPEVASRLGVNQALLQQHLGLCYDTCHQAICFEDAAASLQQLQRAGIRIGKVQLSSALELDAPRHPEQQRALARFKEPRFLHQVRTRTPDGRVLGVDDLDQIAQLPASHPWRVHFHVPVHLDRLDSMRTTRPFLDQVLSLLATQAELPHMEIETYTWSVLPGAKLDDAALACGLAEEIAFARERLCE